MGHDCNEAQTSLLSLCPLVLVTVDKSPRITPRMSNKIRKIAGKSFESILLHYLLVPLHLHLDEALSPKERS